MDVSLVLTSHLYLDQIDDEVHGMDIVSYYPLDFYKAYKEMLYINVFNELGLLIIPLIIINFHVELGKQLIIFQLPINASPNAVL